MASSKDYWRRRAIEREAFWQENVMKDFSLEIKQLYEKSLASIERDIAALYGKYATENGLTMAEARKLIRGKEYRTWRMTLLEYVRAARFDSKILRELNTLAMRKRINRLESLHAQTLMEIATLADKVEHKVEAIFTRAYVESRYEGVFDVQKEVGLKTPPVKVDSNMVKQALLTPWSGKNYSQRIWKNAEKLATAIKETVAQAIHQGTSVQKLSKNLARRMEVGYSNAERLVRTELNYVLNRAAGDAIRSADMEFYQFIATLDHRTTPRCRSLDGQVFAIEEMVQGENAPPMHVRCRSTIAATFGESLKGGTRVARDREGRNIRIPADMNYADWKKVYIDQSMTLAQWTKALRYGKLHQSGAMSGALNDKNDYSGSKRKAHAEMYYQTRRNSKKEPFVKRVAKNSGMSEKAVSKIFDHVFIQKHDLYDGYMTFPPDYYMAESFRRLSEGKNIQPHDMILLKHEWLELGLMKRYGYDYDTAHRITERKYNYTIALRQWHERNGIPWNG